MGTGIARQLNSETDPHTSPALPEGASWQQKWKRSETRLLLVEDNEADVVLIRASLNRHGFAGDLLVLTDGEQAINLFEAGGGAEDPDFDAMILDLNLPKRTGIEVLAALRNSERGRNLPVAVFSSSASQEERQAAAALGANLYLQKSSDLGEFMKLGERIRELLDRPAGGDRGGTNGR
jgi:CheY-like chemotaxis protein